MPAANIDDVITDCSDDIATLSYGGVSSLYTKTNAWVLGMFGTPGGSNGIFPHSADTQAGAALGQRAVSDWLATTVLAIAAIEGPGVGASGVVGTSAVINAVFRTAWAVKQAALDGNIGIVERDAVVALYNLTWT